MTIGRIALLAAIAVGVMAANVAATFLYMVVYSYVIDPGHDKAYYEAHAQVAAPYCSLVAGMPLMPDLEVIKALSPLGVGGLLAVVIFVYYRLDFLRERQNHVAERERQGKREERLLDMIERNAAASERLAVTIENLAKTLEREGRRP